MAKKNIKLRRAPMNILIILILLLGIGICAYPFLSNWYNQIIQNRLIEAYDSAAAELSEEDKLAELEACALYNKGLLGNVILTDPFDPDQEIIAAEEYEARLNILGNGIMGYIEIPKIEVNLSIYHGTSAEVLDQGAGHMENTSLPVGGPSSHAVLSAHTAYAKAVLFNDLVKMEEADIFYLNILGDTLAYQVDQIKVVEPWDTSDLRIDVNEDYVTLITCTPYGVNSHRLLVRGTRIPYDGMPDLEESDSGIKIILIACGAVLAVLLYIIRRKTKRRKNNEK